MASGLSPVTLDPCLRPGLAPYGTCAGLLLETLDLNLGPGLIRSGALGFRLQDLSRLYPDLINLSPGLHLHLTAPLALTRPASFHLDLNLGPGLCLCTSICRPRLMPYGTCHGLCPCTDQSGWLVP
ncbi:hypothetical protein FNV43_RR19510 [Rhamnella rubrinervis]|uniref:Uncharacterized protein n=1 Tax=Rhamnella rubrinervis TaxID=2594499 RepID=A0A8K0DZC6_9ROSA|nr:hypothetical protein FNV43_RR19510 [Rhamnella rubrinervis]